MPKDFSSINFIIPSGGRSSAKRKDYTPKDFGEWQEMSDDLQSPGNSVHKDPDKKAQIIDGLENFEEDKQLEGRIENLERRIDTALDSE